MRGLWGSKKQNIVLAAGTLGYRAALISRCAWGQFARLQLLVRRLWKAFLVVGVDFSGGTAEGMVLPPSVPGKPGSKGTEPTSGLAK